MPELFWWQWGLGALCAANVGMAKTGMPGMGVMVVPLMVLTVGDARLSAGWLLPILCMADVVAIWYWRRHAAAGRLFSLAPFVAIGIAGGAFTLSLNEFVLRKLVGIIIALMLCAHLWRRYSKSETKAHPLAYGVAAGYSTTVGQCGWPGDESISA
jgi:uncharacterized membrane protein YfcA